MHPATTVLIPTKRALGWITIVTQPSVYRVRQLRNMCSVTVNRENVSVFRAREGVMFAPSEAKWTQVINAMTGAMADVWSCFGGCGTDIIISPLSFHAYLMSFLLMPMWGKIHDLGGETIIYPGGYAIVYDNAFAVNRYTELVAEYIFLDLMVAKRVIAKMSAAGMVEEYTQFWWENWKTEG